MGDEPVSARSDVISQTLADFAAGGGLLTNRSDDVSPGPASLDTLASVQSYTLASLDTGRRSTDLGQSGSPSPPRGPPSPEVVKQLVVEVKELFPTGSDTSRDVVMQTLMVPSHPTLALSPVCSCAVNLRSLSPRVLFSAARLVVLLSAAVFFPCCRPVVLMLLLGGSDAAAALWL